MKNVMGNLKFFNLLAPVAKSATFDSLIIDTQGYEGTVAALAHIGVDSGTLDANNYLTLSFLESDTTADADFAAVAAADILHAWPVLNVAATYQNKTVMAECKPHKRYVQIRSTETGTTNLILGLTGVVSVPRHAPVTYTGGLVDDGDAET